MGSSKKGHTYDPLKDEARHEHIPEKSTTFWNVSEKNVPDTKESRYAHCTYSGLIRTFQSLKTFKRETL